MLYKKDILALLKISKTAANNLVVNDYYSFVARLLAVERIYALRQAVVCCSSFFLRKNEMGSKQSLDSSLKKIIY